MNKKYIIRKNEEFQKIINLKSTIKNKYFVISYKKNIYNYNRYGISIGKKLGNAVTRNLIKRQIKAILSKNKLNYSKDYVIICRKEILTLSFKEMENNLIKIIRRIENE